MLLHSIESMLFIKPTLELSTVVVLTLVVCCLSVLQLLASRLACTKDTTPILKLGDQIPLVSMGQPLDLKKNSADLFNQQTQILQQQLQEQLQQQLQQQAKKQSFEDVMKVAAGLMTKNEIPQEVEPLQVISPASGKFV